MKIRKKVLSVFCAAMLLGTITSVTVPQVQASDEQTKKVDGSYLTMQESASGTTQSEDAKGSISWWESVPLQKLDGIGFMYMLERQQIGQ